jgi:hypothetical protein
MKRENLLLILAVVLMLSSCAGSKLGKELPGDWTIISVEHSGQYIPDGIWLKLKSDKRYQSGYEITEVPHAGTWSIENGGSLLVLDSDLGEEDDTQWNLSMQGDTMVLTGTPYDSTQVITMYMQRQTQE